MNIPYSSCNLHASSLTFNKYFCSNYLRNFDIHIARSIRVKQGDVVSTGSVIKELGLPVKVPPYFNVMGAVGAALLSREAVARKGPSCFKGFGVSKMDYKTGSFECSGCSNLCEVIEIKEEGNIIARWGDRCGKWSSTLRREEKIS